jgi:pyruvate-formate lyase
VIPDFRPALKDGVSSLIAEIDAQPAGDTLIAMRDSLTCAVVLAHRYADLACAQARATTDEADKSRLMLIEQTLRHVPEFGARNRFEALQSYMILWMTMCLEQAPNPFAFSVGNADRIFEPYRAMEDTSRASAAELFKCMLVFFNVGDRSWAISQNVLIGGRDTAGNDLTNETSFALLDAYYDMNLPQPILSVKLHKNTPDVLYQAMGRFFFTPGCLTPSLFNDDTLFTVLSQNGVEEADLPDYAVAGCQEPLIMGKDNGNTTNSWFNLPKILELTLNGGKSLITGEQLDESVPEKEHAVVTLKRIRERFWQNARKYALRMQDAANGATEAVAKLPVPFLSAFMGGIETGTDMRDTSRQGTKYNGSGCLIHGLSVVADSFVAIDHLLKDRPEQAEQLLQALRDNFVGHEELHAYMKSCPKFGNNLPEADEEARRVAIEASDIVNGLKNNWGNPFRADFSSPTTHLLYGYWVGATPDGRKARDMLNYGVDPLYGDATQGLGFRVLSAMQLPYERFNGGYASHFGIDPKYFPGATMEEKGMSMKNMVLTPLFFNDKNPRLAPSYLYMNITTAETLREVLANPKKYAPSGVYIMRIHGTFVNFLDLSPAIQQDIITRLDPQSTKVGA